MNKKGFTLIEMLIVVALIGILVGIGGVSIKKQAESRAMIRVTNEIGDFFRVAAKRSLETGKKYAVDFDLVEKKIEIYRKEEEKKGEDGKGLGVPNGKWEKNGIRVPIEELELPNVFEYDIKSESSILPFTVEITSSGNISKKFNFYVIQGTKEVKYVINFDLDDHINYLHLKEYLVNSITKGAITLPPIVNTNLKFIRD